MTTLGNQQAWERARRLYRSAGFQRAYVAGWSARKRGLDETACPYKRRRGGGWQAWRKAWVSGWMSG